MRNLWLSVVDRALLYLGYNVSVIATLDDSEKDGLIIDEYLYRLSESNEDCAMSVEQMAEYIINFQKRN